MFWSVGWPLLRAEDFFYNLDILYGGLGIGKLQFLIKKKIKIKISVVIFWSFKPWIRIGFGSGSVLASNIKLWIRIRKKLIRIHNPAARHCWDQRLMRLGLRGGEDAPLMTCCLVHRPGCDTDLIFTAIIFKEQAKHTHSRAAQKFLHLSAALWSAFTKL